MMNRNTAEAKNWRSRQALNFVTEMKAKAEIKAEGDTEIQPKDKSSL